MSDSQMFTPAAPLRLRFCDALLSDQIAEDERFNTPDVVALCIDYHRATERPHYPDYEEAV